MKSQSNKNQEGKNDIIIRYVYAVTKNLPLKSRIDIEEELKTLIYDMLEERIGEAEPTKKDIEMVLLELGDPSELSEKYRDNKRYLIGPRLFYQYIIVLKIVIFAVVLGMTIAVIVETFTTENGNMWYYYSHWMAGLISGVTSACAWVTAIFAILEWRGIKVDHITGDWHVDELPPVPSQKASIPLYQPIMGIIFTILVAVLFTFAPQLMGVISINNTTVTTIPVFDLVILEKALPLFLICFGLGILREILKLIEGRYTMRISIATIVLDAISLLISIVIFTRYEIWNPNFMTQLNQLFDFGSDFPLEVFWNDVTVIFVGIFIFAFVIDSADTFYRSIRYGASK